MNFVNSVGSFLENPIVVGVLVAMWAFIIVGRAALWWIEQNKLVIVYVDVSGSMTALEDKLLAEIAKIKRTRNMILKTFGDKVQLIGKMPKTIDKGFFDFYGPSFVEPVLADTRSLKAKAIIVTDGYLLDGRYDIPADVIMAAGDDGAIKTITLINL